jgi:hypothetical protein
MLAFLRPFRERQLRWHYRSALRKVAVIEQMALPEDLKRAAISRVMRRFEESLDRYTRDV